MVDAPEKLWMTAEEQGWPGSFRSFRLSDLEHPEEYPAYVRADLYEQVKLEVDSAQKLADSNYANICTQHRQIEDLTARAEAAERLSGARVKAKEIVKKAIENCRNLQPQAGRPAWEAAIEAAILSALAEPAGKAEPVITEAARVAFYEATEVTSVGSIRNLDDGLKAAFAALTTPPDASAIRGALERLLAIAEKQKAYHNAKQHEFPSIEQCVDEDGKFNPTSNLYELLQGEAYNGRYSEADWWACTIRAEIAALAGANP